MSLKLLRAAVLVSVLLLGTGLLIPRAAPQAMTMGTMDRMMGVDRYEDIGHCDFWVVNMTMPAQRIERSFPCGFYWDWSERDDRGAYIHEALVDHERDQVFTVPHMDNGTMEEWYHVQPAMLTDDALRFTAVEGAGVLMPPPGSQDRLVMGWVESGGQKGGPERLVHARNLTAVGTRTIQGIETVHWTSSFDREPATWHGYQVHLSEEVHLWSDPTTGWILDMRRHVTVSMTPSQIAAAQGHGVPSTGGDPYPVMELHYRTTPPGIDKHVQQDRLFRKMMAPIEGWQPIAAAGLAGLVTTGAVGIHRTTGQEP